MINNEQSKELLEAAIPLEDYSTAENQAQDFGFEDSGDYAKDFKAMVLLLNDKAALHPDLKAYCERYQIEYKKPDVAPVSFPDIDY